MADDLPDGDRDQRLNETIAAFLDAVRAGEKPDPAAWLACNPDLADALTNFFNGLRQLDTIAPPPRPATTDALTIVHVPGAEGLPTTLYPVLRSFGDYELLEEVARGGMGVVYKARQSSLNRVVALKMILAGALASVEDVKRFRAEAQTAAALQHPNIVAIHEVGEHEGQHYFSMDFVEGRSLAQLVRDSPLLPDQAAACMRVVAETIHYAHERGVLHRDLKPANILMAFGPEPFVATSGSLVTPAGCASEPLATTARLNDGVPKVTDFGLAKRLGKEGQTTTGAVVGTPAYMPPEQASGTRGELSRASDVYSLGAVLYEMVTGRPPFRAATPLDTLMQVLEAEPAPPRLLNRGVSRDLETVILKCLAKEPEKRYPTARALADDLQAVVEHRPISARRPGLAERAGRWLGRQRKLVGVALAGAALAVGAVLAWSWYVDSRLGHVSFSSQGPPLAAELLREQSDEPAGPRFTVPTQEPVALPAGNYRLRLKTANRLSETFHLLVERGDRVARSATDSVRQQVAVELTDRQLWDPLKVPSLFDVVNLARPAPPGEHRPARNDLILVTTRGLARVDGATGETVWDRGLTAQEQPVLTRQRSFDRQLVLGVGWRENRGQPPGLLRPAVDLDGDGVPDLIWASRKTASLLAVSGRDGQVLWWHHPLEWPALPAGKGKPRPAAARDQPAGAVVGQPVLIRDAARPLSPRKKAQLADLAGAMTGKTRGWRTFAALATVAAKFAPEARGPVLIAALTLEQPLRLQVGEKGRPVWADAATRWVVAVRGSTGAPLWQYPLPPAWGTVQPPAVHVVDGRLTVVCLIGERLLGLDPETGKALWGPVRLGVLPTAPPRYVDLDGAGQVALLLQRDLAGAGVELTALTLPAGEVSWRVVLPGQPQPARRPVPGWPAAESAAPDWPLFVARGEETAPLDADGRAEVIVHYGPEGGVALLEGATGAVRWQRKPPGRSTVLARRFLVGPDLDGDGRREVFRALLLRQDGGRGAEHVLEVEALSGKDGRRLWSWRWPHAAPGGAAPANLRPLRWLPAGPDGWPLLVVPYHAVVNNVTHSRTVLLSAARGAPVQEVPELAAWLPPCDLDGDGLPDLLGWRPSELRRPHDMGRLYALRVFAPEAWRRLGDWRAAADFDGDGVTDLLSARSGPVTAVSGRDGRVLWRSPEVGDSGTVQTFAGRNLFRPPCAVAAPDGDLDGDGTPDVLVFRSAAGSAPLRALSGKSGKPLWSADDLAAAGHLSPGYHLLACRDLDGDGEPEVLFLYRWGQAARAVSAQHYHLAVLSGRTGKVRWQRPLGPVLQEETSHHLAGVGDLNGDGVLDVVVAVHRGPGAGEAPTHSVVAPLGTGPAEHRFPGEFDLLALDGRTGEVLWERSFTGLLTRREDRPFVAVGDLDGDGVCEVAVRCQLDRDGAVRPARAEAGSSGDGIVVLEGKDGRVRWTWTEWEPGQRPEQWRLTPPTLLRRKDGPVLAVGAFDARVQTDADGKSTGRSGHRLILLDADGKAMPGVADAVWPVTMPSLYAHDLSGDGDETLLFLDGTHLMAVSAEGKPRWRSPVLGKGGVVRGLLPGHSGPPTVAVQVHETVFGIDGQTGQVLWRSDGPGEQVELLETGPARDAPRVVCQVHPHQAGQDIVPQFVACRLTLPTRPEGDYLLSSSGEPAAPRGAESSERRLLPWVREHGRDGPWATWWWLAVAGPLFLTLVALRARSRRAAAALLVGYGVVVALCTWARLELDTRDRYPGEEYSWERWYWLFLQPTGLFLALAAPALALWSLGSWLFRGRAAAQPVRVGGWLAALLLAAAVLVLALGTANALAVLLGLGIGVALWGVFVGLSRRRRKV